MAMRPVFAPGKRKNEADVFMTEFVWSSGMSASQKRKNVAALHEAYMRRFPDRKVLEISSKSTEKLGVALSAFNLMKAVPSLGKSIPVECVYQGGKVFAAGGPYTDLYEAAPRDAKRDSRLESSGMLRHFYYEGREFPLVPRTAFYNWIYINALMDNPELGAKLMQYDSFTDIEFNPDKGVNCQAEAAALYVTLLRKGVLDQCRDFDTFIKLIA
ncbi:MAG: DUF6977 family protein [Faecousia sp.]